MFSSNSCEWETPQYLFDELDKEFSFTLDPCASKQNAKCKKYYTKEDNGLLQDWNGEIVFCNPPYGKDIYKWVEKCYNHHIDGGKSVLLLPVRTDTKYFHKFIYNIDNIRFLKGRLKFGGCKNSAPFPSMIVIYN